MMEKEVVPISKVSHGPLYCFPSQAELSLSWDLSPWNLPTPPGPSLVGGKERVRGPGGTEGLSC